MAKTFSDRIKQRPKDNENPYRIISPAKKVFKGGGFRRRPAECRLTGENRLKRAFLRGAGACAEETAFDAGLFPDERMKSGGYIESGGAF